MLRITTNLAANAKTLMDDKEALGQSIENIAETIRYMNSIVADITEMTKADQFDIETSLEAFAIRDLMEKVVAIITPEMQKKELTFDVLIHKDYQTNYIGSKNRLQQILTNFLSNAVKYTPKGGTVTLSIFEEACIGNRASICFVVKDTGIGISKEFLPNLFKPFSRENRSDQNECTSMGLGLSIAQNLIKLMNEDVSVESE